MQWFYGPYDYEDDHDDYNEYWRIDEEVRRLKKRMMELEERITWWN